MGQVNIKILWLVAVASILGYLANGEMIFSYLRQKKLVSHISPLTLMRISLEMNFVNHFLPSGGVSGISYTSWRLGKLGVSPSRATMAQAVRYAAGFAVFVVLLAVSVVAVTLDGNINRWIILISSTLVTVMAATTIAGMYLIRSQARIHTWVRNITTRINRLYHRLTGGRKRQLLDARKITYFCMDMHDDYRELTADRRQLLRPFLWGLVFTMTEVALFFVTFWALGSVVNPASILIAYGVASLAGFIVVTPGGAGAYEAIMVFVLAIAGINKGTAIGGILLARVIILVVTIGVGYIFYQHAVVKYGKIDH